ncbi:unnamed protein product [Mesocestoides corti]|uniref:Uncharacterized protein n=1 Tax=Mesocestoides corti TaxID=53468 RepID=A0A0R3UK47_MESCO|nr:unnamed protein product [Mesocestoides corti]
MDPPPPSGCQQRELSHFVSFCRLLSFNDNVMRQGHNDEQLVTHAHPDQPQLLILSSNAEPCLRLKDLHMN